jgi:site-specific DNA recombinase
MPSTNGHGPKRAILYARVSSAEQHEHGYSLRQQKQALQEFAEREGYEIVAETEDGGQSGVGLERRGLDKLRDLVATGKVSVVLAQDLDRISRDPAHVILLERELEAHGCKLQALDSWSDGSPQAEMLRTIRSAVSRYERDLIRDRTRRGVARKVAEGRVAAGGKPPYGFRLDDLGHHLMVHEPEMEVVRGIFRLVADEETLDSVANELARRGVPSPTGKPIWNKPALRWLLRSPVYEAQEYEEVVNHVSLEVASRLKPGRRYGLWPYGTRTVKVSREWDAERGDYRNRYAYSRRPEEELAYVPVPDSGIPRETVLRAREELGKRRSQGRRDPERIWELRGVLRCPDCGSVLRPYTNARRNKNGSERRYYYYSCRSRFDTAKAECSFRKNLPADATEEAVWGLLSGVLSKPEVVAERFERFLGDERRGLHGTPEREAAAWEQRLKELEEERRGYLRLAAQGRVVDHELDTLLSEVEEQRERAQEELRQALGRKEHLRTLAHRRELVLKLWKRLGGDRPESANSAERMQWYERLQVTATPTEDGDLRLRGLFDDADVSRIKSRRWRASRPASRPSGGLKS